MSSVNTRAIYSKWNGLERVLYECTQSCVRRKLNDIYDCFGALDITEEKKIDQTLSNSRIEHRSFPRSTLTHLLSLVLFRAMYIEWLHQQTFDPCLSEYISEVMNHSDME